MMPADLFSSDSNEPVAPAGTVIKVLGLGGGGSNAVNRMIELGLTGVEFITCNTDHQALDHSLADVKVPLGPRTTRGLGAGGNPDIGEAAAQESTRELADALQGADMVFLTAGMGGGTGTGAIPVAAEIARSIGAIVVAIVTVPFSFEGKRRQTVAQHGLEKLRGFCNTLITIPNDRLLEVAPKQTTFDVALRLADDVLRQGVQAIAELITRPGLVNVDFSHVRSLMQLAGGACLAVGHGTGPDKAVQAVRSALHNPMLEIGSLETAAGLLVHFTGGEDLELAELQRAMLEAASGATNAEVFFGAAIDPSMKGRVQVIIVATGVGGQPLGSVIEGASHILLKNPRGEAVPVAAVRRPAAVPAMAAVERLPAAEHRLPVAAVADSGFTAPPSRPIGRAVTYAHPATREEAVSAPASARSVPSRLPVFHTSPEPEPVEGYAATLAAVSPEDDLELPAFLRRRARVGMPDPNGTKAA